MQFQSLPSKISYQRNKVKLGAGANSWYAVCRFCYWPHCVPNGYIFNGVMGAAQWCSCPSVVLLDILTDTRYGFGNHITDSSLDLFSFVTASKFANALVDDGFGGQEANSVAT